MRRDRYELDICVVLFLANFVTSCLRYDVNYAIVNVTRC
jgi:hypothetical protein